MNEVLFNMKKFQQYVQLREADEQKDKKGNSSGIGGLNAKISLGDGNDYEPFFVSDDPNSEHYGKNRGLAPIIRAFKKGANWGWSKDEKSGIDKPVKVGSKKLYLTGGAVRDHLAGKTPRNIELTTNASPDEIYHILKQNDFAFMDSDAKSGKGQSFSVKSKDKNGRPFSFNVNVDDNHYELEVFTKTPKGHEQPEPGTHSDDAAGRDFTMNAMSIALTQDNGPNKELNDFFGGMHHLAGKRVQPIGDMKDSFSKDPKRIVRYARMVGNYGDAKNITPEEKEIIKSLSALLKNLKPDDIMGEFKKGIKKDDVDARKYLQVFSDLGLLGSLFPEKSVAESFPKELSDFGDKNMPIAWALRHNHPMELSDLGLDPADNVKVVFLVKALGLGDELDETTLQDLTSDYVKTGISSRKLKEWCTRLGGINEAIVDAFIQHAKSPRVKVYVFNNGVEEINEEFKDLFDPFTGLPVDQSMIDERKRNLEYRNFQKHLPKGNK